MKKIAIVCLSLSVSVAGAQNTGIFQAKNIKAPTAATQPKTFTAHGDVRQDPYYWLNERDNPAVKAYLEAENDYAKTVMAPTMALQKTLFDEMKARIKEDDSSVPYTKNGFSYYTRFEVGGQYPLYCRRPLSADGKEEVLLNVNQLAAGTAYFNVGSFEVSPDNQFLLYSVDTSGRNMYQWFIRDLTTQAVLTDRIPDNQVGSGTIVWGNDGKHFYYTTRDAVTLRDNKVWRHSIGEATDELVYEEKDETAYVYMYKDKTEQFVMLSSGYTLTVENQFIDASDPMAKPRVIVPRQAGLVYSPHIHNGYFYIVTNKNAKNYKVVRAPLSNYGLNQWQDVIPHRADVLIEGIEVFKDYLVLTERKGGLKTLRVIRWADMTAHDINFGEPTYEVSLADNQEYDTPILRYNFTSLKTPASVIDYNMADRSRQVLKVAPVLGGFNSDNYETAFIFVTARDGAKVPVSLIWRKGTKRDGSAPMFLTGYGSYGSSYYAGFNREKLSLLDRGFVCGIAHIRGGMEMGFEWYEAGKMGNKINTFTDFIDCMTFLTQQKYTQSDRLFIEGRSAGGLLMGAVINMAPQLFKGAIVGVPFVDVITTMSDPSIPLTTGEYTEWGNPADKAAYFYMKSYSPYDNLTKRAYPNILVTTSFSDSQVQYFEPAKWVARLRTLKTDQNLLLFETNMTGSHGGSSGRFNRLNDRAKEYAFILGLLGRLK